MMGDFATWLRGSTCGATHSQHTGAHPKFPPKGVHSLRCLHEFDGPRKAARSHVAQKSAKNNLNMIRTYDFLAPSLHPNTLLDISIPEPGPSSLEPIVRHLPIKYGEHQSVGGIKRMQQATEGSVSIRIFPNT